MILEQLDGLVFAQLEPKNLNVEIQPGSDRLGEMTDIILELDTQCPTKTCSVVITGPGLS